MCVCACDGVYACAWVCVMVCMRVCACVMVCVYVYMCMVCVCGNTHIHTYYPIYYTTLHTTLPYTLHYPTLNALLRPKERDLGQRRCARRLRRQKICLGASRAPRDAPKSPRTAPLCVGSRSPLCNGVVAQAAHHTTTSLYSKGVRRLTRARTPSPLCSDGEAPRPSPPGAAPL